VSAASGFAEGRGQVGIAAAGGVAALALAAGPATADLVTDLASLRPRPGAVVGYHTRIALVGIEGTGSYGAGLARHMAAAGVRVVEVDRSDRQDRRRQGKSDPLDAVSAARAAQSGRARGAPKGTGRRGGGGPGADGRQAQRPLRADPGH